MPNNKRYFFPNEKKKSSPFLKIVGVVTLAMFFCYGVFAWLVGGDSAPAENAAVADAATATDSPAPPVTSSAAPAAAAQAPQHPLIAKAAEQEAAGNLTQARAEYEHALTQLAQTQDYPAAAIGLARVLQKDGNRDRALQLFNEVKERSPGPWRAAALHGIGTDTEAQGDKVKALELYEQALKDAEVNSDTWNAVLDDVGRLNVELIFSPMETPETKYHTIESGESLTSIGIKLNTTQGLLMRANNITDPATLRVGQRLKTTPKDFRILIERSTCRMFLLDSEGIFKRYYTGLGMPGYETALGNYTVGNKQKDPTWFKPGSAPIPPGDPTNELGTRWMPLMPQEEGLPTDLGIHGTIEPETIGQYKSHGCPRLKKEDVEELYDLVVRSTPVSIVEVIDWETMGPADATLS